MANYDEFKKKAGETAGYAADKGVEFAKCAADKARILARMAAVRTDLALERETLKKSRVELGKAYYKKFGENEQDEMSAVCAQVKTSLDKIARQKSEIGKLKEQLKENPFAADDEA